MKNVRPPRQYVWVILTCVRWMRVGWRCRKTFVATTSIWLRGVFG